MKKIILSLGMIVFVGAIVIGATGAFFSDTETSTDNTFTAGAIDLQIDNESYYNSQFSQNTSWGLKDLMIERFFDFSDVKPGDDGEDTISLHVNNNASWLCADVTLTSNNDNTCTEPEGTDESDNTCGLPDPDAGELANNIEFIWWADDGDNVLEDGENLLPPTQGGALGSLGVGGVAHVTLADSSNNIWTGGSNNPIPANEQSPRHIAKAWCFGDIAAVPLPQNSKDSSLNQNWSPATDNDGGDNEGNGVVNELDGGFSCSGASSANNVTQTDSFTADISFYAVQSRNNTDFLCSNPRT